jgi:hypothetical protein
MVAPRPILVQHLIFAVKAVQSLAGLVLVSSKFVRTLVLATILGSPAMATRKTKCDRRNQGPIGG